jgi:hypothetical protein
MPNMLRRSGASLGLLAVGGWLLLATEAFAAGNETLELNDETGASAGAVDPSAVEPATIDGFRSARFGMTESEVRAAIATDFGIAADQIEAGANAVEKTSSLAVTAPDLVPDSGPARVVYIFGYQSKALIQVNIVWGADPASDSEQIRTAASLLVSYFRSQNYDPEKTAVGVQLANGALLAFYAEDADGSSVTLTVASRPSDEPAAEGTEAPAAEEQLLMQLSYVGDFANPDIFRLAPGSF